MSVETKITITHDREVNVDITNLLKLPTHMAKREAVAIQNFFNALVGGARMASVDVQIDGGDSVAANGTITFSGVGAANDTILINGVTFTAVASGATGNQWNVGGSATLSAAALASAINASATALVSGHVSASAVSGVITLTAVAKGVTGNAITVAEGVDASSHMAVSGARLTGGTAATANAYAFGV